QLRKEELTAPNVTIEGDAPSGNLVTWVAESETGDERPLLELDGTAGLRLQGFRFDGRSRVRDLVTVTGLCPGLTLENLHCQGFLCSALRLNNCWGEEKTPVTLRRVRTTTASAVKSGPTALNFVALPQGSNGHIAVVDCRFEGACRAALEL